MARTESAMLELNTPAPYFALRDVTTGREVTLQSARGPLGLLLMFLCTHCPFVQHLEHGLAQLGRDYSGKGIGIVATSSNDAATFPDDSPAGLAEQGKRPRFPFPYRYDETQ